jgi:hypothetical protein
VARLRSSSSDRPAVAVESEPLAIATLPAPSVEEQVAVPRGMLGERR